jgi:hypothetical protein
MFGNRNRFRLSGNSGVHDLVPVSPIIVVPVLSALPRKVKLDTLGSMYCNNCGAENDGAAKFCANCGTTLGPGTANPAAPPPSAQYQPPPSYQAPNYQQQGYQQPGYQAQGPIGGGNSMGKNIGIGCLVAVALVFFVGLSCTRACFGLHRASRILRYR